MRLALCFSLTETVLGLLSSSMMVGGTTTSRWPVIDIIGSVFTWVTKLFAASVALTFDLAHVVSAILCLHVPDLESPGVVAVVLNVEPEVIEIFTHFLWTPQSV